MSIYRSLIDFAVNPHTGEGWDAALRKAEKWRDVLEEMQEVASPGERDKLHDLCGSLEFFFREYNKYQQRMAYEKMRKERGL